MNILEIQSLWESALIEVLGGKIKPKLLHTLSYQTNQSIRRISVYESYKKRAEISEQKKLPYYFTSNPLVLTQRESIPILSKLWYLYLATYFGKSARSEWLLFRRSAFREDLSLYFVNEIIEDIDYYFQNLKIDFFADANFSNHRKYTKKSFHGQNGFFSSARYFLNHINEFNFQREVAFHQAYMTSLRIPSFGRMASFDYACSLCKCNLNVTEPKSMYLKHSTGPRSGFKRLLIESGLPSPNDTDAIILGNEILCWFKKNSNIFMLAQVIEDAICNWQKNPQEQKQYFG